jgi:hypothetical protein
MKELMSDVVGGVIFSTCVIVPVALYWFGVL